MKPLFAWSCLPVDGHWKPRGIVGRFTTAIPHLKAGTRVLVDGPHGIFTAAQADQSKILLIAGGIGITPIRAQCNQAARRGEYTEAMENHQK